MSHQQNNHKSTKRKNGSRCTTEQKRPKYDEIVLQKLDGDRQKNKVY